MKKENQSERRVNLKRILEDPDQRRKLMVTTIIATQAREGITTTREQAEAAYDAVQTQERRTKSKPPIGRISLPN